MEVLLYIVVFQENFLLSEVHKKRTEMYYKKTAEALHKQTNGMKKLKQIDSLEND